MKRNEYFGLALAIALLTVVLAVFRNEICTAQAIEIIITFTLVLITVIYVKRTAEIAKANIEMVTEAEKARFATFRPILKVDEHTDTIEINDISEEGELKQFLHSWHCVVRNIGVGPALKVKYSVLVGNAESTIWESQVLETKEKVEEMQDSFTPEIIPENSKAMICVEYEDIFGNIFQSTRQLVLEKDKFVIGPLELYEIEQEINQ